MACSVAWMTPRVPYHIDDCVLSMSRIYLCTYSGALLRSRSPSGSRLLSANKVWDPPFGILSFETADNIGPWQGSTNPKIEVLLTMTWSLPKLRNSIKNGSSGLTLARPRATAINYVGETRAFGVIVTMPGVSHVAMIRSSWCLLTRLCLQARTLGVHLASGGPRHCRSDKPRFALAEAGPPCSTRVPARRSCENVAKSPRCFFQRTWRQRRTKLTSCRKQMHETDKLSEARKQSKRRTPPVSTYTCIAYWVTRRLLFASRIRGSVVSGCIHSKEGPYRSRAGHRRPRLIKVPAQHLVEALGHESGVVARHLSLQGVVVPIGFLLLVFSTADHLRNSPPLILV